MADQTVLSSASAEKTRAEVAELYDALTDFMEGDIEFTASGKQLNLCGRGGVVEEMQVVRALIEAAQSILETTTETQEAAETVADLTVTLKTSLDVVSKLGGVFGSAFKVATQFIDGALEKIEDGANSFEKKLGKFNDLADDLIPVLENTAAFFEVGLEPLIEGYIREIGQLRATVDILHDAVDTLGQTVPIAGLDTGAAAAGTPELPLRLAQALVGVQAYAAQMSGQVDRLSNDAGLPGSRFFGGRGSWAWGHRQTIRWNAGCHRHSHRCCR
ncbi:hypothetical protein [Yoonia sp. SS1-5]|uniref:Uncharacterized protein n=1 Tax=Yoonia rhodophyticola TaxID=3137370 RepID=A0AAN0M919_9RHOB